jgi:single-strand DNA-binding protein
MEIVGRIVNNAVVKQLKDNRQVVNFTVAINDYYKPKGSSEGKQVTAYVNCAYWLSPKIAERLTKGSLVEISGRPYVTAYVALDGEARASLNCHVNSIKIHSFAKKEEALANETDKTKQKRTSKKDESLLEPLDDLPF